MFTPASQAWHCLEVSPQSHSSPGDSGSATDWLAAAFATPGKSSDTRLPFYKIACFDPIADQALLAASVLLVHLLSATPLSLNNNLSMLALPSAVERACSAEVKHICISATRHKKETFAFIQGWSECPSWLPRILCLRVWDASHTPEHDPDDAAIWGEFDEKQARWPAWILVGAAVSLVSTAPSPGNQRLTQSAAWSLIRAAANGSCIGIYIAIEFFHDQTFLQV